jgi:Scaffold protein Nfu/NifU N terminal
MGQPINVVQKPTRTPGVARFETNRSLTGMGHERYESVDDILAARPVDELARRLFATGGVKAVHVNNSVVTVQLNEGWSGDQLVDVIRGLYIHYPGAADAATETNGESGP